MNPFGSKPSQFADTEPMAHLSLASDEQYAPAPAAPTAQVAAPIPDALGLSLAPIEAGEYELMAETRKDNRVCPLPTRWLEFYRILQDAAQGDALPAPPLTGSAWASTPTAAKRACFREQIEWAVAHGSVTPAYDYLRALPPSDWSIA